MLSRVANGNAGPLRQQALQRQQAVRLRAVDDEADVEGMNDLGVVLPWHAEECRRLEATETRLRGGRIALGQAARAQDFSSFAEHSLLIAWRQLPHILAVILAYRDRSHCRASARALVQQPRLVRHRQGHSRKDMKSLHLRHQAFARTPLPQSLL